MRQQEVLESILMRYQRIRARSIELCARLETEDYVIQSYPEVSPPKWHLAHTTWFFENFILKSYIDRYQVYNPYFDELFNSYYKSCGKHWLQAQRGILSRPTVADILQYRHHVDEKMAMLLEDMEVETTPLYTLADVGLHHEQQHQELLLMDIKSILSVNLSQPAYDNTPYKRVAAKSPDNWVEIDAGLYTVGAQSEGFAYDNERPAHQYYLPAFSIAENFVTNGEYLKFIEDNGYARPLLWLSDGWNWAMEQSINAPLYWSCQDGQWQEFTLHGTVPLDRDAPVCHISYYEADAFARWRGLRLPREQELEVYLLLSQKPDFPQSDEVWHPSYSYLYAKQLWAWSQTAYHPYPGFHSYEGALGEYNAKFMCNQYVLRGGAFATPREHYRPTYRNFYYPHQRWMFSGISLVKDL